MVQFSSMDIPNKSIRISLAFPAFTDKTNSRSKQSDVMQVLIIDRLLSSFSIRQKLWFGSLFILLLLVLTVSITRLNTAETEKKVTHLSKDIQPAFIAAMQLMNQIKHTSTSMGFYLLTHEELHKKQYEYFLFNIGNALTELKQTSYAQNDSLTQQAIKNIVSLTTQLNSYKPQLITLAENYNENYIAVGFANEHLNPINQELLQAISNMVLSESTETARRQPGADAVQSQRGGRSQTAANRAALWSARTWCRPCRPPPRIRGRSGRAARGGCGSVGQPGARR